MPSKKNQIPYNSLNTLSKGFESGFNFVDFPDCFLERLAIDALEKKSYKKAYGPELTIDWIEETILSPGLFGAEGPFLILEADKMPAPVKKFLIERDLTQDETVVCFTHKKFSEKKLLAKYNEIKVTGPKFWEMNKYLQFLSKVLNLNLDMQSLKYLEDTLEPTTENYFTNLSVLKTYQDEGKLDLSQVKSLIKPLHIDNFELADYLNSKNLKRFFLGLLKVENDYEVYRSFFIFIQGHIAKLLDPSYTGAKAKLSKYDQSIVQGSKKWKRDDLVIMLEKMINLEIMSKEKNIWLRDKLREEYLKTF